MLTSLPQKSLVGIFFLCACGLLSACFSPERQENLACSPEGACPSGLICGPEFLCIESNPLADAAPSDGTPADGPSARDAAPVDADPDAPPPVDCVNNPEEACDQPPSLCHRSGSCNEDGVCDFPEVQCQEGSACQAFVCDPDDGDCKSQAINQGGSCGTTTCGAFGPCQFDSECDELGTQSRTCTDRICQGPSCVSVNRIDTADCQRSTEGQDCGIGTTCGAFGDCLFSGGVCIETGTQSRSCTERTCQSSSCVSTSTNDVQTCTRNTGGNFCGNINCPTGGGFAAACCVSSICQACGPCDIQVDPNEELN